ncbi:MAG: MATE family efflux transporter [Firmicutes bacterium]|nr:MATE family efflux transporter [Bacillota bacterium]
MKTESMTEGNIAKQIMIFALPLLLGNIFQQLYNTVDVIVVGRYVGKEALAAVGASSPIVGMLVGAFVGLSTGSNAVIAQYYGAGDMNKLHKAIHTAFFITLLLSAVFTVVGIVGSPFMLGVIGAPEDVFSEAVVYLRIYFFGISGVLIYNMTAAILRSVGDSKRPFYFLCFASLLNVLLDILFVVVIGMGIEGVAWATFIAQMLSAGLCVAVLVRNGGLSPKEIKNDVTIMKEIMRIGLPGGLQQLITAGSNVIVQAYINHFGSSAIAGFSAYLKIDSLFLLPAQSMSLALVTYVGQNAGAGKIGRAKEGAKITAFMAFAVSAVMGVAVFLFSEQLVSIFSKDTRVIYFGNICVKLLIPLYFTLALTVVYAGALRGFGESMIPMVVMTGSYVVFRQIYLFVVSKTCFTFEAVQLCYPVTWILSAIVMYAVYKKGRWIKRHPEKTD